MHRLPDALIGLPLAVAESGQGPTCCQRANCGYSPRRSNSAPRRDLIYFPYFSNPSDFSELGYIRNPEKRHPVDQAGVP